MSYFLLLLFLISSNLKASDWVINTDHSEIFFQVKYLNVSDVTGRFDSFSGTTTFDETSPMPQAAFIKIDSSSINTGNPLRDGHLKSHDFLKVKDFPFITFKSTEIQKISEAKFRLTGDLTLADVTRNHALEFTITEGVKDTWNYDTRFVTFRTSINRKDFKLRWNKTLPDNKYLVGDEIAVWGTLQLQPARAKTPPSKHMIPDTTYMRKRERVLRGEISEPDRGILNDSYPLIEKPSARSKASRPLMRTASGKVPGPGQSIREETSWKISFWILGLMAFVASIVIGLYSKKLLIDKYPLLYKERGILGLLTDAITIVFVMLFAIAFWEVGWG